MIKINKEHAKFMELHGGEIIKKNMPIQDPLKIANRFSNYEIVSWFYEILMLYLNHNLNSHRNQDPSYHHNVMIDLNKAIQIQQPTRSKVIGKHFNYDLNVYEYELENGDFIPVVPQKTYKSIIDIRIFPLEFIKLIDVATYRSLSIEQIII